MRNEFLLFIFCWMFVAVMFTLIVRKLPVYISSGYWLLLTVPVIAFVFTDLKGHFCLYLNFPWPDIDL